MALMNNIHGTKDRPIEVVHKPVKKLKKGQKITIPRVGGEFTRRRKAVVEQEFDRFYLVATEHGYKTTIHKTDMGGVRLC